MARRAALTFLALSSPAILLAFVAGTAVGEVAFALLAMAFPVALIALGAQRRGSYRSSPSGASSHSSPSGGTSHSSSSGGTIGPLLWPLVALVLVLETCVVAMLVLRGSVLTAPWFGGLPLAAAIQFYGLFLLPLALVSFAYAWSFERFGLRQKDLDELRRRFVPPKGDKWKENGSAGAG